MLERLLGVLVVRDIFAKHGVVLLVVRRDDRDQRLRELVLATGIEEVEAKVGPLPVEQAALVRCQDVRKLVRVLVAILLKQRPELVADDLAERVVEAIESSARTGKIGDGKIFIYDLEQVIRIRTGETGNEAL